VVAVDLVLMNFDLPRVGRQGRDRTGEPDPGCPNSAALCCFKKGLDGCAFVSNGEKSPRRFPISSNSVDFQNDHLIFEKKK
jgi:hypothetical protein